MNSAGTRRRVVPAPRTWLGIAFLGVWLYFFSQVFQVYKESFADSASLSVPDAIDVLRITSNLGQILFLSGVAAALWRANLAAGLTPSSVRGLVIASAAAGVLVLFEVVLLSAWFRVMTAPIRGLRNAYEVGNILGVALGLAGIASLGVGLTNAVGLFGRPAEETARAMPAMEKTG